MRERAENIAEAIKPVAEALGWELTWRDGNHAVALRNPAHRFANVFVRRDGERGRFEASVFWSFTESEAIREAGANFYPPKEARKLGKWDAGLVSTSWSGDRDPAAVAKQIDRRLSPALEAIDADAIAYVESRLAYARKVERIAERLRENGWEVKIDTPVRTGRARAWLKNQSVGSFTVEITDDDLVIDRSGRLKVEAAIELGRLADADCFSVA